MEQRDDVAACIARLAEADRHLLRELPHLDVARMPGIYALWVDEELLYIGIARVDPGSTNNARAAGVAGGSRPTGTAV